VKDAAPYLSVAVAATGAFTEDYEPTLLEIGVVLVTPSKGKLGLSDTGQFHALIRQPEDVLSGAQFKQAVQFHGITPDMTMTMGEDEADIQLSLEMWRTNLQQILLDSEKPLAPWRAFDREFVSRVLDSTLWLNALGDYASPGPCVMKEAAHVLGAAGELSARPDGTYPALTLTRAAQWLQGRGYALPQVTGRALRMAQVGGALSLALAKEHEKLLESGLIPACGRS